MEDKSKKDKALEEDLSFSSASFEVITFENDIFSDEGNVSQSLDEGSHLLNSIEEQELTLDEIHLQNKDVIDIENALDEKSLDEDIACLTTPNDTTLVDENENFSSATIESVSASSSKTKERSVDESENFSSATTENVSESRPNTKEKSDTEVNILQNKFLSKTESTTREKLKEAEAQVARLMKQLEEQKQASQAATREKMKEMQRNAKKAQEKEASKKRMEKFLAKQQELKSILKDCANADVAFMLDCTGSMASYIAEAKRDIEEIVRLITAVYENDINFAFVGYRDHCDGADRIESLDFTQDIEEFRQFVGSMKAKGGGDTPEDVLGGLDATLKLNWSSQNRVIFHIADAPGHGPRLHDLGKSADSYYGPDPNGLNADDIFKKINEKKIQYYFGKTNDSTSKMIRAFQEIAGKEVVHVANMKDPANLIKEVVTSLRTTIDTTISKTLAFVTKQEYPSSSLEDGIKIDPSASHALLEINKRLKEFSISEEYPEIEDLPKANGYRLICTIPRLVAQKEIRKYLAAIDHKWSNITLKKGKNPFAQGEQRISYHGVALNELSNAETEVVLKEFKHAGLRRDRREDYIEIMETQAVAAYLADSYNKIAPEGTKKIDFVAVSVVQLFNDDGSPQYYNLETLLPDHKSFRKWNTNAGHVNEAIYSSTLDAFSHWTYDFTEGFLVVCDLQGISKGDSYMLTDPSINCIEPKFGRTNLGEFGIEMFFKTHSCGDVCKAMNLKRNKFSGSSITERISAALTRVMGR